MQDFNRKGGVPPQDLAGIIGSLRLEALPPLHASAVPNRDLFLQLDR